MVRPSKSSFKEALESLEFTNIKSGDTLNIEKNTGRKLVILTERD
jgi:hypothetical protein